MAYVRVEQRNAHLASPVRLISVQGRDGEPVSKATLTAISNTRKGSRRDAAGSRGEEATAIQWTLWGQQADNAAKYLSQGSHVNVAGRVQNNDYERDGQTVYALTFTAEELDYLDSKAEGEALRERQDATAKGQGTEQGEPLPTAAKPEASTKAARISKARKVAAAAAAGDDDVPF